MSKQDSSWLERLSSPLYFVAFLFVVLPLIDFGANIWPLQLGDAQWRYGSGGLFTGFMLTSVFGLIIGWVVAAVNEDRGALRVLTIGSGLSVVVLVLLGLEFLLDTIQVHGSVPPKQLSQFDLGAAKALVRYGSVALGLGWVTAAGWRVWRGEMAPRGRRRTEPSPLVSAKRGAKEG